MDQIAAKAFVNWADPKEVKAKVTEYRKKVPLIYLIVPDGKHTSSV